MSIHRSSFSWIELLAENIGLRLRQDRLVRKSFPRHLKDALSNEPQICTDLSPQVVHLQTFQPIPAGSIALQILLAEVGLVWMGLISCHFLHVKVFLNNWLTSLISW